MGKPFLFWGYICRSANLEINTQASYTVDGSTQQRTLAGNVRARMIVRSIARTIKQPSCQPQNWKKFHLKFPTVSTVVINMEKANYTLIAQHP
jgi:hypothetical protein